MSEKSNIEMLVFLFLGLVYTVCSVFGFLRVYKIRKFDASWGHAKLFYIVLLIQSSTRAFIFLLLLFIDVSFSERDLYVMASIPASLFASCFMLLHWLLVSMSYLAHMPPSYTGAKRYRCLGKLAFRRGWLMAYLVIIWILLQVFLYIFYTQGYFSSRFISEEVAMFNLSYTLLCILSIIALSIRFSGTPTRSGIWKQKLSRINWVFALWIASRILVGIFEILTHFSESEISNSLAEDHPVSIESASLEIIKLILGEVICIFIVFDYGFMSIFDPEENATLLGHSIEEAPEVVYSEIELEKQRQMVSKWGELYLVTKDSNWFVYRKLCFPRISSYVIEDFKNEYNENRSLQCVNLVPICGICIEYPNIGILYKFMDQGSLFEKLHVENYRFSFYQMLETSLWIARSVKKLHKKGKTHGHLSSKNIFIENNRAFIADFGLNKVKKYASIIFGYSIKSAWSSPQILAQPRAFPAAFAMSDDVYSTGIIIYEIFTRSVPFLGYSISDLAKKVGDEGFVLQIPDSIPYEIASLIMETWNKNPSRRPSIAVVKKKLKDLLTGGML